METSTHFGLNLVTGSDKVNPLTIDRPNYEKIDDQMYKNQINSASEATELKSGTVHAITCLTEGAVFFRFTATSDFVTGDTFTYNGTPVSAVLPNGEALQTGAYKINGTVLCSIIGTLLTVYSFKTGGTAEDSEKLGGQLPSYYAKAVDAVPTFIHSRIGNTNNIVGTGNAGRFLFASNIQSGDVWQVNGQTVNAYVGPDDATKTLAGANAAGKGAYFIVDNNQLFIVYTPRPNVGKNVGASEVSANTLVSDVYTIYSGYGFTDVPTTKACIIEYLPYGNNYGVQRLTTVQNDGGKYPSYVRSLDSGAWSAWTKLTP